jgi:hypothetical protein
MNDPEMAALVLGITEIAKKWGVPSKHCALLAVCLGVVLSLGEAIHTGNAAIDVYTVILRGVLVGVATTGSYAALDKFIQKASSGGSLISSNANSIEETH